VQCVGPILASLKHYCCCQRSNRRRKPRLPPDACRYVHRVGRTGRAGESGTAISLLAPSDAAFAAELAAMLRFGGEGQQAAVAAGPAAAAAAAVAAESDSEEEEERRRAGGAAAGLQPHSRLTSMAVEGLRYRAEDVARSITRNVIREARAKELKNELLNSQRLAAFFEEHPGGELQPHSRQRLRCAALCPAAAIRPLLTPHCCACAVLSPCYQIVQSHTVLAH
jgi:ATP-dependent RNA helicase DDX56/DBP9